jgi:PAS domain S-box-containing protein
VTSPIVTRTGDTLGILSVHFRSPYRPSDQELEWLTLFVRLAADFIERCRGEEALRKSEQNHRRLAEQLRLVTETMAAPVALCSSELRYLWISRSYAEWLNRSPEDVVGRQLVEILGAEAFAKLLPRFQAVLSGQVVRYEEEVDVPGPGRRWVSATYTPTFGAGGEPDGWVAVVNDIDAMKQAQEALRQSVDIARAINEAATWHDALYEVLHRLCKTHHWQIGFIYIAHAENPELIRPVVSCFTDERFKLFHDRSIKQFYARRDWLPGRVYVESAAFGDGDAGALSGALRARSAVAVAAGLRSLAAVPVTVQGEVIAVVEVFSVQAHPLHEHLTDLMHTISDQIGRVLEREQATARMADLVWREQQALLHALHDSLGQTLTALGMLSSGLRQRLASADADAAQTATEIVRQTQQALDQVRLLAKRLFPLEVEAESLMAALRNLASATEGLHGKIHVRVDGEAPRDLRDGKVVTELYRIAQEAITNSVKHAHATMVRVWIDSTPAFTRIQVVDDGVGLPQPEPVDGAGLQIMRYRAASIGASLSVQRGMTGGTVVTCTLRTARNSRAEQTWTRS